MALELHNDPELFTASVKFTADQTGFAPNLIEKDYLCSLVLAYLESSSDDSLIFKGGTCLAKVYFDFNRLSEDLDFVVSTPTEATRKERSARMTSSKKTISDLPSTHRILRVQEPLAGRNQSRQYLATLSYTSFVTGNEETIKLEIGLREPLLTKPIEAEARTILLNAANPGKILPAVPVTCLSVEEALAEKFRAALSRRDVAIRDFYDLDYAAARTVVDFHNPEFIEMTRQKLAIPGNDPPNTSDERLAPLRAQLEARLKPVLRTLDYDAFDLDRAIGIVRALHKDLENTKSK